MTMMQRSRIGFAALLSLLVLNAPAFATDESNARENATQVDSGAKQVGGGVAKNESSLFVGRWHWNRAQSTLPPGEPAPNDLICEFSRADGNSVTWSVTIVTPDGQSHVVPLDAAANGESRRISSDTTASARLTGDTLEATFQGPTGRSDAQTCTVSTNQQQMTCRGVLTDGLGHTVSYVDVYDRM